MYSEYHPYCFAEVQFTNCVPSQPRLFNTFSCMRIDISLNALCRHYSTIFRLLSLTEDTSQPRDWELLRNIGTFVCHNSTAMLCNSGMENPTPFFAFVWPCIVTNFFIIKPTRCTNFINLFWHETLHVSDNTSVHYQEFIHCTLKNGVCHTGL